nr:unnamed protein product [Digitaria exilis]
MQLSKFPLNNFASHKFADSPTGRGYLEADVTPGDPAATKPIHVATTQLERPAPPAPMRCAERHAQARHAVAALGGTANVVLGGDMSWGDDADGPFPLPAGWADAWAAMKKPLISLPSDDWTHDAVWNEEPAAFLCKLRDYRLSSMIGDQSVGLWYVRESLIAERWTNINLKPSCHRGVVLTIVPK